MDKDIIAAKKKYKEMKELAIKKPAGKISKKTIEKTVDDFLASMGNLTAAEKLFVRRIGRKRKNP